MPAGPRNTSPSGVRRVEPFRCTLWRYRRLVGTADDKRILHARNWWWSLLSPLYFIDLRVELDHDKRCETGGPSSGAIRRGRARQNSGRLHGKRVRAEPRSKLRRWRRALVGALLLPAAPVMFAVFVLCALAWSLCLHFLIWTWWCARGQDVLFIYSDSPLWREYIEQRFLPYLGERAIVLNWSERSQWRLSLGRIASNHFGGDREFNPLAVVFRPLRRTRTFRFWKAFRGMKQGRPVALQAMEREFFDCLGISREWAGPTNRCGTQ